MHKKAFKVLHVIRDSKPFPSHNSLCPSYKAYPMDQFQEFNKEQVHHFYDQTVHKWRSRNV